MPGPLLGLETRNPPCLPCAASVPNLIAARAALLAETRCRLNVRRLMYQPLIFAGVLRHQARGLASPLDTEDVQGAADPLIHCMG